MPLTIDKLPGLTKAALEIAYDNGGINRGRTEADAGKELIDFLAKRYNAISHTGVRISVALQWAEIDRWLNAQTPEDLLCICAGDDEEQERLLKDAPAGTDELLNDIFEEVC